MIKAEAPLHSAVSAKPLLEDTDMPAVVGQLSHDVAAAAGLQPAVLVLSFDMLPQSLAKVLDLM